MDTIEIIENSELSEESWMAALNTNPVFDFLKTEEEIYSITDGKPLFKEPDQI